MPCLSLQAPRACALCIVITVTAMLLFLSNGDLLTSYACVTTNELCGIKKTGAGLETGWVTRHEYPIFIFFLVNNMIRVTDEA